MALTVDLRAWYAQWWKDHPVDYTPPHYFELED